MQSAKYLAGLFFLTGIFLVFELTQDHFRVENKISACASQSGPGFSGDECRAFGIGINTSYSCTNKPFKGILLVVTFNFPFYENIPLLSSYYNDIFEKVVYCGLRSDKDIKNKPTIEAPINNGYFGYQCMELAIARYPGFQGYLYINDDMIVNWWMLLGYDRRKVWQGPEIVDFSQESTGNIRNKLWMWWSTEMGLSACHKSYEKLKAAVDDSTKGRLIKQALDYYLKNGDGVPRCGKGWSDLFYVPGHLAETAKIILNVHREQSLFLEISVNNMLRSLDLVQNFEVLKGLYLPDIGVTDSRDGIKFWKSYHTGLTFIHPFKFAFEEYREMNIPLFKNWIIDLSKRLSNCHR